MKVLRISKLFMISACLFGVQPSHCMVNKVLDYVQYNKAPIAGAISVALLAPVFYKARWIPYDLAVRFGYPTIVKNYLIATRNSPDVLDYGLMIASANGRAAVVKMLIDAGADVNKRYRGEFPLIMALHNAQYSDNPEAVTTVKYLLAAGADPFVTRYDNSASDYVQIHHLDNAATRRNKLEIQRLLRFYKAQKILKPQVEHLLERKKVIDVSQEELEKQFAASGSQARAKDVADIIKGYL